VLLTRLGKGFLFLAAGGLSASHRPKIDEDPCIIIGGMTRSCECATADAIWGSADEALGLSTDKMKSCVTFSNEAAPN
jgi:hypothetical protein